MTKKEMFVAIRNAVLDNEEMVAFIDHEIDLLERKSTSPKKPTETQRENTACKAEILKVLSVADKPVTIKELVVMCPCLEGKTNQRITHMLTDLVKAGKVDKVYIKKVVHYFLKVDEATEGENF